MTGLHQSLTIRLKGMLLVAQYLPFDDYGDA